MSHRGFTLIDLLVTLVILGILLAITLPAVQASREASRRIECTSHLRQMGIAIQQYETLHGMFPPGGAYGASLHVALLPFIDQQALYEKYDFIKRDQTAVQGTVVPLYVCPSDPTAALIGHVAATNYAGNCGTGVLRDGYNGMFRHLSQIKAPFPDGPIRRSDFRHGLADTAAVSEILHADGTVHRLRLNWYTPQRYDYASQFDDFARVCDSLPPSTDRLRMARRRLFSRPPMDAG